MKRRLLATLLSLVMIVGLLPTSVFAENGECDGQNCTHEAAIGSRHYDTLSEALTAVSGETTVALINNITLSEDITLNTNLQIPAGVNVTIDGGGRKITAGENYGGGFFTVNAGATLDLVNVTLDGGVAYKLKIDKDEFDYTLVYGQSDLLEDPAWERTEPLIKVDNCRCYNDV